MPELIGIDRSSSICSSIPNRSNTLASAWDSTVCVQLDRCDSGRRCDLEEQKVPGIGISVVAWVLYLLFDHSDLSALIQGDAVQPDVRAHLEGTCAMSGLVEQQHILSESGFSDECVIIL